jgi:3-dehydroquinate synthase
MMKVKVELGSNSYEIRIGAGLLGRAGLWLKETGLSGRAVIITDNTVKGLYGDALSQSLSREGFSVATLVVPPGEEQKSLENAGRLYHELTSAYAERTTPILALGGGVVGDLAGFVAATYMRGVPLIQVPTTLLAQADSSLGGKTAVDHGQLKNTIGVFHQPVLVVADTATLKTLSDAELANGLAEVIKSAAVGNRQFFAFLEKNLDKAKSREARVLEDVVQQAAGIKARIVAKDERDTGRRLLLNYGHTIGHALEAVSGFRLWHGQAVAIGMVAAARISRRLGVLPEDDLARLRAVIKKASLPTSAGLNTKDITKDILQAMQHDKKVVNNKVRFVLLKAIGEAFVTDEVSTSLVEEALVGE